MTFKRFRLVVPNRPCGAFVETTDVYDHVMGCRVCLDAAQARWNLPPKSHRAVAQYEQEAALPAGLNPIHLFGDPNRSGMRCGEKWRIGVRHTNRAELVTCPDCRQAM